MYAAIQEEEAWKLLNHGDAIAGLAVENVACKLQLLEVREFRQFFDVVELRDLVGAGEKVLQPEKFLDSLEVPEAVVINFEHFDGEFALEGVGVQLPHLVVVHIQVFQLLQVLQTVDFYYLVLGGLQDLQLVQLAQVQPIEVLQQVAADVQDLQAVAAIKTLED